MVPKETKFYVSGKFAYFIKIVDLIWKFNVSLKFTEKKLFRIAPKLGFLRTAKEVQKRSFGCVYVKFIYSQVYVKIWWESNGWHIPKICWKFQVALPRKLKALDTICSLINHYHIMPKKKMLSIFWDYFLCFGLQIGIFVFANYPFVKAQQSWIICFTL